MAGRWTWKDTSIRAGVGVQISSRTSGYVSMQTIAASAEDAPLARWRSLDYFEAGVSSAW